MNFLTITITNTRQIDGFVEAAKRAGLTPEELAEEFIAAQGRRYADTFRIGIMTSAAFIARFTPSEFGAILTAAQTNPQVAGLIGQLTDSPNVAMDDPRLLPGLQLLVSAGLLAAGRVSELLSYQRP